MSTPRIKNHQLYIGDEPVRFVRSPNQSGVIKPTYIVCHDTAGHIEPRFTSVTWFENPKAKASAHFVVERDGIVTQCVATNRKAWHAGKSIWKGRSGLNDFSIGIEIVNPGLLTKVGDRKYRSWFKKVYTDHDNKVTGDDIAFAKQVFGSRTWSGYWMDYTPEQIASVMAICQALTAAYPIQDILTHWQISPGRKVDTNPLFPLEHIKSRIFGRGDEDQMEDNGLSARTTTRVNLRKDPQIVWDNIVEVLEENTKVEEINSGKFPRITDTERCKITMDEWLQVKTSDGKVGWVMAAYVAKSED